VFHEGSGKVMNTIPPNDFSYYEMLNDVVQQEPATSLDPELMGPLAAIGIVKGKPFTPDARMNQIITEALALANATSRSLFINPREADWYYYPGSSWQNYLFISGYQFETPIPEITREGAKPFPAWWSRRPRRCSVSLTTFGTIGWVTSASPGQTAGRVGNSCSCHPATKAMCHPATS
jgi:hypothetical protein